MFANRTGNADVWWRFVGAGTVVVALAVAPAARGQCAAYGPQWEGMPGLNSTVYAIAEWDPDGAGPTTPRLAVGGAFSLVGEVSVNHIASYDPATGQWSALGSGMNNAVRALTTLPNGDLVAGGDFTTAGGVAANRIARWDGTAWSPLGTGMDDSVGALTILPNGDLIAGG